MEGDRNAPSHAAKFCSSAVRAQEAHRSVGGNHIHPLATSPTTSAFPAAAHAAVSKHMYAALFS